MKNQNFTQKNKTDIILLSIFLVAVSIIGNRAVALNKDVELIDNARIEIKRHSEPNLGKKEVKKSTSTSTYAKVLAEMGKMGIAYEKASKEFNVPLGLMIGIANAESSLGKNFYNEYDKNNCHNWIGLKGGNMTKRKDGSWLRCFTNEEAGARTFAKTLRLYYLDEGRTTPEKIAMKWVGKNQTPHHKQWIKNVNKYYTLK